MVYAMMPAREIFEAEDGRLSMSRVLSFLSFWPATWVLILNPTEGMLGIYLTAFGVAYLGGKGLDVLQGAKNVDHQ